MTYTRKPMPMKLPGLPPPVVRAVSKKVKSECIYLGDVLPRETGPCKQRLRRCDVFGVCTLRPCDKAEHSCEGCPRFETDAES